MNHNGQPVETPGESVCTYDELNQMLTAVTPEGTTITNTYNGNGQRVAKQIDTETTKYVYVGSKVVLELDGASNQTARNVQGTNLISRTVDSVTYYYMYNGHGDVTALIDAAGNIQAAYYYDAFGNIIETTGTADNPYKYAGYVYDEETKYYYLNARYYDPLNARFISEDSYRGDPNDPLSLNLYTYCHNNPIKYYDPTGHYIDETKLGALSSDPYYTSVIWSYSLAKATN
jgi:RHS repeat-associated protein